MRKLMLSSAILGAFAIVSPLAVSAQGQPVTEPDAAVTTPAMPLESAPAPAMTAETPVPGAVAGVPEGYSQIGTGTFSASTLMRATVYDQSGQSVGTVSDLHFDSNGALSALVLPVGGLLGMGATDVELPFTEVQLLRQVEGEALAVQIAHSREQIEAMASEGS